MALPESILMRGTRAAQPAATTLARGVLYYVTDESVTEQTNGTIWVTYADGGGGGGGGSGDVVGPASAVNGHLAVFDTTTGKLLKDGGAVPLGNVVGPASAVDSHLAVFDTTTGKLLKDGGAVPAGAGGNTAPVSGWTGVNVSAAWSAVDVEGAIEATLGDTGAGVQWRGLFKAVPATPFHVIFHLKVYTNWTNSVAFGMYFYDGTKLYGIEYLTQTSQVMALRVQKITNVSTDGSSAMTGAVPNRIRPFMRHPPFCYVDLYLRLGNDGANLTFDWSGNGVTWTNLFTEAVGSYMTPTHYGFGGLNIGTGDSIQIRNETATLTA
jgi:hypothetical protein